jgi:N-methylhydantoinase B
VGKIHELHVNAGDTRTVLMPGGGGFGDAYLRDPESVLKDVILGFVTRTGAKRDYGVVVKGGAVDVAATKTLRQSRKRDNVGADFGFGGERLAWEAVFDDATMTEINQGLLGLPKSVRHDRRRRLFEDAVPGLSVGNKPLAKLLADPDAVRVRLRRAMTDAFAE